jgi:hypothetical protein
MLHRLLRGLPAVWRIRLQIVQRVSTGNLARISLALFARDFAAGINAVWRGRVWSFYDDLQRRHPVSRAPGHCAQRFQRRF